MQYVLMIGSLTGGPEDDDAVESTFTSGARLQHEQTEDGENDGDGGAANFAEGGFQ